MIAFLICSSINGIYIMNAMNELIELGIDVSTVVISPPFNLDIFGVILGIFIAQLGVSSAAYYALTKAEHKIQLPIYLINDLPKGIKEQVDMTEIITSVLSNTND